MKFHIKEGRSAHLCNSCRAGMVRSHSDGRTETLCYYGDMVGHNIQGTVTKCSRYRGESDMTEYEAKAVAWVLEVTRTGRVIGFKPPQKVE